jgi:hypothetical protein
MFSPDTKAGEKPALEGLDARGREKVPDNAPAFSRKY